MYKTLEFVSIKRFRSTMKIGMIFFEIHIAFIQRAVTLIFYCKSYITKSIEANILQLQKFL